MTAPVARRGFTEAAVAELIARRAEPEWMRERRLDAWQTYQRIPMPTRQDEEWRRTDLRRLKLDDVQPYSDDRASAGGTLLPEAEREEQLAGFLGLRNAQRTEFRIKESLTEKGVIFTDLASAVRDHGELVREYFMTRCVPASDSKFAALHGAFWDNGIFLYVPRGVAVELPLRAVTSAELDGAASLSHTLIVLEAGAQAIFAETFLSPEAPGQGVSSRVTEIILKQASVLNYASVQDWGRNVYDFHTERALLDRDTALTLHSIELGSQLSKGRVEAILHGDGANAKLRGLYLGDDSQHLDRYTLQDHRARNGTSDLLFKGVLTGTSRSVYSGLIRVTPEGKGTAAYQQNRNLLLSRTARADSIPNLEIGANDILGCTHGATVGKVDEEQVFYLMCRGLSRAEATRLIVQGFVDPLVEAVPIAGLREALRQEIQERASRQIGDD
jgi:Fe-S cluster assembly protein SufD